MSTNKKNDLLVDDATVQHPKDVRGVLIKVWIHFYTEKNFYGLKLKSFVFYLIETFSEKVSLYGPPTLTV